MGARGKFIEKDGHYRTFQDEEISDNCFVECECAGSYCTRLDAVQMGFLKHLGLPVSYIECDINSGVRERKCKKVPIGWALTRLATATFVRRHPYVEKGSRFEPLLVETFHLDATKRPRPLSIEILKQAKFPGIYLKDVDFKIMDQLARLVFEVLERAWQGINQSLNEVRIRFGKSETGDIMLKGLVSSPKRAKHDDFLRLLITKNRPYESMSTPTIAIMIDSGNEQEVLAKQIIKSLKDSWRITNIVSSVHESTQCLLEALVGLKKRPSCKCIIAIPGKSNVLSLVLAEKSHIPVVNCFPLAPTCTTISGADYWAKAAALIVANGDIYVWCGVRCQQTLAAIGRLLGNKPIIKGECID